MLYKSPIYTQMQYRHNCMYNIHTVHAYKTEILHYDDSQGFTRLLPYTGRRCRLTRYTRKESNPVSIECIRGNASVSE
jgi:hypothetical protein